MVVIARDFGMEIICLSSLMDCGYVDGIQPQALVLNCGLTPTRTRDRPNRTMVATLRSVYTGASLVLLRAISTHIIAHSLNHSPNQSLAHPITHSLIQSPNRSPTHPPSLPPTHLLRVAMEPYRRPQEPQADAALTLGAFSWHFFHARQLICDGM